MSYNGWTNYETWNVALWLDNDEDTYNYVRALSHDSVGVLADALKDLVEESAPDLGASMYADMLGAALGRVDWREIAFHYIEEQS